MIKICLVKTKFILFLDVDIDDIRYMDVSIIKYTTNMYIIIVPCSDSILRLWNI